MGSKYSPSTSRKPSLQSVQFAMKFTSSVVLTVTVSLFAAMASASIILPSSLTKRECGEEAEFCLQTTGTMGCCPDFVCSPAVNGIPFGGTCVPNTTDDD
ncbi:hypothetical protein QCA50_010791 [Cerrena zonata]|uniref:Uncharacterized protein n=1 Tax=Cerrena zonata TaxID=2478898 RepID=A0AAW0G8N8_9APHY